MVETINRLVRAQRQLLQTLGREPSPEEVAKEMELPVERVREIDEESPRIRCPWKRPSVRTEDSHRGDFIQDDQVTVPADAATFTLLHEQLMEVLDTLTEREQKGAEAPVRPGRRAAKDLEEVGREFNVTRERIRQIEPRP